MPVVIDYYKTLGLTKGCTADDIKKAYRNLALKYHPLRNGAPTAKKSFMDVSESFDVLGDAKKRAVYDQYGADGLALGVPEGQDGETYPGGYTFPGSAAETIFHKFFGVTNPFDELFAPTLANSTPAVPLLDQSAPVKSYGPAFGGMAGLAEYGNGPQATPKQPASMEFPLRVTLEELYNGAMKKATVQRKVLNSDGKTTTVVDKVFTIEVQKGWKAGTKVIFPREGDQGPNQVPSDVVFVVEEIPHATFHRHGTQLLVTKELSLSEALTGTKIHLTTLDDRALNVNISEVIRPGYTKTIKGEGMPKSKAPTERGDLLISFDVHFPQYLSESQKSVLKKTFAGEGH